MLPQSSSKRWAFEKGAKYGTIAGLIATWTISSAIAASELELGMPMGTFYAVMGISLGAGEAFDPASLLGFGLHLITGAVLGGIIGYLMCRVASLSNLNPYRTVTIGICAGVAVWLVLFLPVTAFLVQPSITKISYLLEQSLPTLSAAPGKASQFVWGIALSAIVFHVVWGAIFGYITSAFLRIRALHAVGTEGRMMK